MLLQPALAMPDLPMAAFGCLGLAILAALLPIQGRARWGWSLLFLAACGFVVAGDTLDPRAVASLACVATRHARFSAVAPWLAGILALPVGLSSLLFAAAHLGGGLLQAAIAGLAGLGYALVHARSRRIEAAILTHFAVNAVHFLGFTYPGLAP